MADPQQNYRNVLSKLEAQDKEGTNLQDVYDFLSLMPGTGDVIGAYEAPGIIRSGIEKMGEEGLSEKAKGVGIAALGTMGMIPLAGKPARAAAKVFSKIDTPVFHYTTKPGFTKFDKSQLAFYDFGPHVGSTPKAAEDRFISQVGGVRSQDGEIVLKDSPFVEGDKQVKGGSVPLQADLSKPFLNPKTNKPFTEEELIDFKAEEIDKMFKAKGYKDTFTRDDLLLQTLEMSPDDVRKDFFPEINDTDDIRELINKISQNLAEEGFTHVPYVNKFEDVGALSYEMLVDRPKGSTKVLQSPFAKKDPSAADDPDIMKEEGGVVSMKDKAVNINRGPRGIEPFVQYFENGGIVQSIKDYIGSFFEDDEEPAVKTKEPDYELPKTSVPYGIRRAEEGRFKDMIFQGPGEFEKRFKQKGVYDYKNPFDPTLKENIDRYYVLPDDPYVKPPPSAPTYRSGVEFGDTETGFDLLNKMKFNPVLQAGLRDNRSLTDYVKYLKEEYPYGREIMGRAAGFYTPSDNIIYMRQKQRMKPFGDTVQLYNFNDKSEATLVHELMHKGAELLRRDSRVDLSFLKNQLESGAPVRRNESKEIKAEHRYLQAIVNTAYMDNLLEKAGAEQTYLEGRLFERLKNAPDEATAKLIKNEIGTRRFYKEREKKMALLSEANRVYDLYFEPSMRGPFAETIKENFDIDIASGQFLYDFKKLDSLSLDDVKSIFNITNSVMAQDQATKQYKEQIEKGRVSRLTKAYPYYFPKQIDSYRRDEIDDLIREDLIKENKAEGGVIGLKDKAVNMYRNRL